MDTSYSRPARLTPDTQSQYRTSYSKSVGDSSRSTASLRGLHITCAHLITLSQYWALPSRFRVAAYARLVTGTAYYARRLVTLGQYRASRSKRVGR
eukprot:3941121-Rhodomonas_salina.7